MTILDITLFFVEHKLLISKIITRVLLNGLTTAGVMAIVIGIIKKDGGMSAGDTAGGPSDNQRRPAAGGPHSGFPAARPGSRLPLR